MNEIVRDGNGQVINVGDEVVRLISSYCHGGPGWPFGGKKCRVVSVERNNFVVIEGDSRAWAAEKFLLVKRGTSGVEDEWGPGVCQALVDACPPRSVEDIIVKAIRGGNGTNYGAHTIAKRILNALETEGIL